MSTPAEFTRDLERSILAICLWDAAAIVEAQTVVVDEGIFDDPRHSRIWSALLTIQRAGDPVDPHAVAVELGRTGIFAAAGGKAYLSDVGADPAIAQPSKLAGLLEALGHDIRKRATRAALTEALARIDDPTAALGDVLDTIMTKARDLGNAESTEELPQIGTAVDEAEAELDAGMVVGTPTQIEPLDVAIQGGIKPQQVVVIAGATGSGKTALATQIAVNVSQWADQDRANRGPVAIFSFEMSRKEIVNRMVLQMTPLLRDGLRSPTPDFPKGGFSERDKPLVRESLAKMKQWPLYVEEKAAETIDAVRAQVERFVARTGQLPSLVIVDHIGLLNAPNAAKNGRTAEVGAITRGLKNMARTLDIPVIALAQMNRQAGTRDDHRPRLSDLRESGSIEQDANIVVLLYRESYYFAPDERRRAEEAGAPVDVDIAKNRAGPIGTVKLEWVGPHTSFRVPPEWYQSHGLADPTPRPLGESAVLVATDDLDLSSLPILEVPDDGPGDERVEEELLFAP